MLALDPNNAKHFIYSTSPAPSYQTWDGGRTFEAILGGMWHVGIDRQVEWPTPEPAGVPSPCFPVLPRASPCSSVLLAGSVPAFL